MATEVEIAAGAPRPKNPNKVRKRAPKACLSCRARKVRCDVSQRGRPCMNCYLDSETCVVTGRASRLRKSQRPATTTGPSTTGFATIVEPGAAIAASQQPGFPSQNGFGAGDEVHNHDHGDDYAAAHIHSNEQSQQNAHQHPHQHAHQHSHSHSYSHSHQQLHQHGSPQSEATSRHRTASIKGSPRTHDSERPPSQHPDDALHNSPPMSGSPDAVESLPRMHGQHQQSHQQSNQRPPQPPHQQQPHPNQSHQSHNQYHHQSRFNGSSFNDDPPPQAGFSRGSGNGLSSSDFLGASGHNSVPWAAEQGLSISADITYSYYPFLAVSNLSNILPQDVNYLELQGCLRVPTRTILDEFVQQYFLHVHPLLPLFNEGDFWELYCQQGVGSVPPAGRMSLLVFQALLFATCNFVSRGSIRALGFPTIRLARAALYRRAKLLFDFETESSPAAIAQAALLLSFWSPSTNPGTKNPNTAWLCTAIQQARLAEANHYASLPLHTEPARRRANALKRLWWCCILRDRVMGLGVRRSIQITRAHFDLEANPPLNRDDLADEIERSRVYNPGTKSCLIEILVHMVELCVVLTDILTLVFPPDDTPGWGRQMADGDAGRVRQCKIELRRWYKDVALKFPMFGGTGNSSSGSPPGGGVSRVSNGGREFYHDSVILYTNLMYMYYHSSRVALCHHEVLHLAVANAAPGMGGNFANGGAKAVPVIYENRYELQDAASGVTECLKELIQLRLARWLPISAVACTALPLFLHILDVKLSTPAQHPAAPAGASSNNNSNGTGGTPGDHQGSAAADASTSASSALKQHRLNILIEAMKTYQPQYDGVDWVSETIRHIVNLAQIDGPSSTGTNGQTGNSGGSGSRKISDWTDILASNPSLYLRLAFTMDMALSKNRMPEERDFPVSLRGLFSGGGRGNLRLGYGKDGSEDSSNATHNQPSVAHADTNGNINTHVNGSNHNELPRGTNNLYGSAPVPNQSQSSSVSAAAPGMAAAAGAPSPAVTINGTSGAFSGMNTSAIPITAAPAGLMHTTMDDATAATAAAAAAFNGGGFNDDYSAAFMLAPHHLAMSMGMAMGMDMDMDLDMDMDMGFPPLPLGGAAATTITPGVVTQLPSSDGETSPASLPSEAAHSTYDDQHAHHHPDGHIQQGNGAPSKNAGLHRAGNNGGEQQEGDEWIEPAWDDEGPAGGAAAAELREERDRDTARALLEAMGE